MRAFFIGLQFLTRLCIVKQDNWTEEDFGASVKFFPLIGAVLGVIYAGAAYLMTVLLPEHGIVLPHHLVSVTLLVLPILMSGGIFCDGFMDTMDGVFSGRSRERMLEIMKDSCVGSNAVFCFVALMLWEWGTILDMEPAVLVPAFFAMPIIARLMVVILIRRFPLARPNGLGRMFADYSTSNTLPIAIICTLLLLIPCGILGYICLVTGTAFAYFFAGYVTKRIGGVTGDVYGATATLTEALVLLTYLVASKFIM